MVDNLRGTVSYITHHSNPFHLVFSFELLYYALLFGKLSDKQIKYFLRILDNLCEIGLQIAAEQELIVDITLIFL